MCLLVANVSNSTGHSKMRKRYRNSPNIFSQDDSLRLLGNHSDAKKPFLRCYDIFGCTESIQTILICWLLLCFKEWRETAFSVGPREVKQHMTNVIQPKPRWSPFLVMTQTWWENSALSFSFIFSCNLMFNTSCLILSNLPPSPHSHCASSGSRPITSAMNALMESCIPVSSPFLISSNDPEELLYNTNQVTFFHSFRCYFFTYPLSPLSLLSCRSFPIWLSAPENRSSCLFFSWL